MHPQCFLALWVFFVEAYVPESRIYFRCKKRSCVLCFIVVMHPMCQSKLVTHPMEAWERRRKDVKGRTGRLEA